MNIHIVPTCIIVTSTDASLRELNGRLRRDVIVIGGSAGGIGTAVAKPTVGARPLAACAMSHRGRRSDSFPALRGRH